MEAASRSPLEPLPDLPVEEPLDAAVQRAKAPPAAAPAPLPDAAGATGAAPPKDPAQTGITLIDAAMLVLEPGSTVMPAPPVAAAAPVVPPAELELVLEDPVVEELLTSPPPPPVAKPATPPPAAAPAAAASSPAAAKDPPRDERVPIIRT